MAAPTITLTYETTDVFTNVAFGGNPLAVVFGAEGLPDSTMQKIAAEFCYSETTFVLPPVDPTHTAHVHIFTPVAELPFAGHPNVGTAFVLARRGEAFGRPVGTELSFEEESGLVEVSCLEGPHSTVANWPEGVVGAVLSAPKPFAAHGRVSAAEAAACMGLGAEDVVGEPLIGSTGGAYVLAELASAEALERCRLFREAGADLTFLEAPRTRDEMATYCREVDGPKMVNNLAGGLTPSLPLAELREMGFSLSAYPLDLLAASIVAQRAALEGLREGAERRDDALPFDEMQEAVGFAEYYREEARYK